MNPGSYEYKFFVGDHFEVDEYKPVTANWCQNHFLIVTERTAKVHQNITDIRRIFNKYQKDLPKAYPEICIEAHVFCFF